MPKTISLTAMLRPTRLLAGARRLSGYFKYRGSARYCALCGRASRRFKSFGHPERVDACCFFCGSLERHRFLWIYLKRRTVFFDQPPGNLLHFAPEPCLESRLRKLVGDGYITADIEAGKAMVQIDITSIDYPDESFDVILCSHVLEHVPDDAQAMRELYRVLKPDGWALLVVPIEGEKTFESPGVTESAERLRLFGQEDHVRIYGKDFADRLHAAGFKLECITPDEILSGEDQLRNGIPAGQSGGDIYRVSRA